MNKIKTLPQPIPKVTRNDVERVSRRDFTIHAAVALDTLKECNQMCLGFGEYRVQLAILKLGNCNLERLRQYVEVANQDPRDVLVQAEYPEYARAFAGSRPVDQQTRIIDSDWNQYQEWLNR